MKFMARRGVARFGVKQEKNDVASFKTCYVDSVTLTIQ
jgi:hypothetical protein